jgi:hypothetical protein
MAAGVAGSDFGDALDILVYRFNAPEAAAAESCFFKVVVHGSLL